MSHEGGDNIHYRNGSPALMSDGRFITDYRHPKEITDNLMKANHISDIHKLREFIRAHGDTFQYFEFMKHIPNQINHKTACSDGYNKLWTKYGGSWDKY